MSLESGGVSGGTTAAKPNKPPKRRPGANPVVTAPKGPPPTRHPAPGGRKRDDDKKRGGRGGTGRPGTGGAAGYEKRQIARENEAQRKAADRYVKQAKNLESQAKALQHALNIDFHKGLMQQLGDITESMRQQDAVIMEGYRERYGQLAGSSTDNEKAQVSQSTQNVGNRVRERNAAIGEATAQGAGESDVLAAQLMSLRNWNANQNEVERGYHDTLRSINSSLTDLNVDTKTARMNNELQSNADKEQLWTNYYDQRSETYTQLGNVRGQQADYYASAQEMDAKHASQPGGKGDKKPGGKGSKPGDKKPGGKGGPAPTNDHRKGSVDRPLGRMMAGPGRSWVAEMADRGQRQVKANRGNSWVRDMIDRGQAQIKDQAQDRRHQTQQAVNLTADNLKQARKQSEDAFLDAAKEAGKSWDNPGVSDRVMDWQGKPDFENKSTLSNLAMAPKVTPGKRPEGATLRKW